jgi:hypothetical protein
LAEDVQPAKRRERKHAAVATALKSIQEANMMVGFEVVLIGGPFIVAAMLSRELSEETR